MVKDLKKEVARLRSEVRQLSNKTGKAVNPFTGIVSGNYWTQTGIPWVSSEGRKAVLQRSGSGSQSEVSHVVLIQTS